MDKSILLKVLLVCFVLARNTHAQTDDEPNDVIENDENNFPLLKPLIVPMFKTQAYSINVSIPCDEIDTVYIITAESGNLEVLRIHSNQTFRSKCIYNTRRSVVTMVTESAIEDLTKRKSVKRKNVDKEATDMTSDNQKPLVKEGIIEDELVLTLEGKLIGITNLVLRINKSVDEFVEYNKKTDDVIHNDVISENAQIFQVFVLRMLRPVDRIFMVCVPIFLFLVTVGFGCKLDLGIVKECIKKPVAPGIGLSCQYIIMPLIGFSIAKLLPDTGGGVALGIFVCGICPGGGVSNIYTYLLDGDVSLSITMTFLSTVASIVMMPLWLYTLGTLFLTEQFNVSIPWVNLIQIIALVTVPLFIGLFLKYKFLKVALFIIKILKPLTLCAIIVLMVFAFYANWYIFKLFTPLHILAGCLLPYLGYIFGGVVAILFRQPTPRVKAIILETGMQNVGVAYLLMISSLPPPHGDLASVAPMASAVMTPVPVFFVTIAYVIYKKYCKKYEPANVEDPEVIVKTKDAVNDDDLYSGLPEKLKEAQRETFL